jgi:hypothetical protein
LPSRRIRSASLNTRRFERKLVNFFDSSNLAHGEFP